LHIPDSIIAFDKRDKWGVTGLTGHWHKNVLIYKVYDLSCAKSSIASVKMTKVRFSPAGAVWAL
jgi:hypothetical protein